MFDRVALSLTLALAATVATGQQLAPAVATVMAVKGQVLLSRGSEFTPAQEGAILAAGDRLMTLSDSKALVAFADGCEQTLAGDSMVTIGEKSDCLQFGGKPTSFRQALGETDAATGDATTTLTDGQKWLVAAVLLIPTAYYFERRNDDNDDDDGVVVPPISQ
ncbi:hypothetical protein [Tahibacter amnicola]|uniref:Uncharacterized protein n=1 Tax=Tahibacter amnicola TaxID=2976241 RepID=A0ABY6B8I6_9GAMM|nr:hypothetical protein [Tahibacter amnicola]UXI66396.1 hypothetical protein N4264_16765 [Tahibacter amnicola]